ncbi:MAG TPA: GFA family protein [Dongiaceae bacterium]
MGESHLGQCFCGAVEIEAEGEPLEMGFCHCGDCRSYTGAPLVAFALFKAEQVRVTRGEALLGGINKTGMSHRRFCTRCGGHLMTGHPALGCTDVYAAKLPSLAFRPSVHLNYAEAMLRIADGLPKLKDFPAHVGGSGETVIE